MDDAHITHERNDKMLLSEMITIYCIVGQIKSQHNLHPNKSIYMQCPYNSKVAL